MTPVEQRQLFDPENGQSGDCWKCCLASILNLPYEDVPHFVQMEEDGEIKSYWNATQEWLKDRGFVIASFALWGETTPYLAWGNRSTLTVHEDQGEHELLYHFTAPGHWIAGVSSPRLTHEDGSHGLHAVVMRGHTLAFDPHPRREMGHLGFCDASLLVIA